MNVIKIVNVGQYVGAVKPGKCPMYAVTEKENKSEFIAGLKEDFPNFRIEGGTKKGRAALARVIIRSRWEYIVMPASMRERKLQESGSLSARIKRSVT